MFTQEEKEQAKYFKFSMDPLHELNKFLNPRFLPLMSEQQPKTHNKGNSVRIPQQIILFWHDLYPPLDVTEAIKKIHLNNPHYRVLLFNSETAGQFIKDNYGQEYFYIFTHRCVHPAMQSDFFRICYLAIEGGVYVDVDIDCYDSVDRIYDGHSFTCFLFYTLGNPSCIDNDFIACSPKNPILRAVLDKIYENLTMQCSFSNIWECTGPGVVTVVILELLMKKILSDDVLNDTLQGLILGDHSISSRAYSHLEHEYKHSIMGNWRYFELPRKLYLL